MASEREGEEPKKSFKVVDRRRFTEEGEERTGPDVARDAPSAPAPQAARPAPQQPAAAAPPAGPAAQRQPPQAPPGADRGQKPPPPAEDEAGISFTVFLQSMAQQALMQLGLIPWPHGQRELALEQARDTIDVLSLLRTKTKGNLTPEEESLFETVIYELRMSYVEVNNAIARQAAAGGPGGMRGPGGMGGGGLGRR